MIPRQGAGADVGWEVGDGVKYAGISRVEICFYAEGLAQNRVAIDRNSKVSSPKKT